MIRFFLKYLFLFLVAGNFCFAQSIKKGDVILGANYGVPHLFKKIVKFAAGQQAFIDNFDGKLEVSEIKGLNPIAVKGEYGINKFFGIGFSYASWSIKFDVTDYYKIQNQNQATHISDSADVYKLKISSNSFGIRPNLHIPIKNRSNDVYFGIGLGFTKNKLSVNFSSTDAGRIVKVLGKSAEGSLSLPGGFYFAPSIGYRHYFGEYVGLNAELGYEKGAIVQGGIVFRFCSSKDLN